jgi:transcription elongation factor GreB
MAPSAGLGRIGPRKPLSTYDCIEIAMSRAADQDQEDEGALPPGQKNYITPEGLERLKTERRQLWNIDRPEIVRVVEWAAGNGDRSENGDYIYGKKRLREIDRRLRFLDKRLAAAEPVDPSRQTRRDTVFFGATVTYVRADDSEVTVTICGIDETTFGPARISWTSPVARALMRKQVGDMVKVQTPAGVDELEILAIAYPG